MRKLYFTTFHLLLQFLSSFKIGTKFCNMWLKLNAGLDEKLNESLVDSQSIKIAGESEKSGYDKGKNEKNKAPNFLSIIVHETNLHYGNMGGYICV